MSDTVLELKLTGEHFRRRYLVYVVELSHGGNQYFYIGQTGDTRVITARPVFRRLAAHFEDRKSTQNQVYQYIAHKFCAAAENEGNKTPFTESTRQKVEEYLTNSDIRMLAYHLEPFLSATTEEHTKKRRKTQKIENQVVAIFRRNGRTVMNKKSEGLVSSTDCPYPKVLEQVAKDFRLK